MAVKKQSGAKSVKRAKPTKKSSVRAARKAPGVPANTIAIGKEGLGSPMALVVDTTITPV